MVIYQQGFGVSFAGSRFNRHTAKNTPHTELCAKRAAYDARELGRTKGIGRLLKPWLPAVARPTCFVRRTIEWTPYRRESRNSFQRLSIPDAEDCATERKNYRIRN